MHNSMPRFEFGFEDLLWLLLLTEGSETRLDLLYPGSVLVVAQGQSAEHWRGCLMTLLTPKRYQITLSSDFSLLISETII